MTLDDYRDQFKKNMMIMSRTANGKLGEVHRHPLLAPHF